MMRWDQIVPMVGGRRFGPKTNRSLRYFEFDSRRLADPTHSVFVAISGEQHDGHRFIRDAYDQGIRYFLCERLPNLPPDAHGVVVGSSIASLQKLAAGYRAQWSFPVVGITGSYGKTIVKEWLAVLLASYKLAKTPMSFNSQLGVPLSILHAPDDADFGLFEAGISLPGEMDALQQVIQPQWGILTNIGAAHLANFRDNRHLLKEKLHLFAGHCRLIVRDTYYQTFCTIFDQVIGRSRLLVWGDSDDCNLRIQFHSGEVHFTFDGNKQSLPVPPMPMGWEENLGHCIALLCALNIAPDVYRQNLNSLSALPMRMETVEGRSDSVLINDAYSLDVPSLNMALHQLREQSGGRQQTVILSDFPASTPVPDRQIRSIVQSLKQHHIPQVITIGRALGPALQAHGMALQNYPSAEAFIAGAKEAWFQRHAILVKGARQFQLEKIVRFLSANNHQTRIEINLASIRKNLLAIRHHCGKDVRIMAMVKAAAYGAGQIEIARFFEFHRVDYLGVAFAEEGIALRKAGIQTPILVLNSHPDQFPFLLEFNLEPAVYSLGQALTLQQHARARNVKFPVHLELETGMHRLGISEADWPAVLDMLQQSDALHVTGCFSHLAAADDPQWDAFTRRQIGTFHRRSLQLEKTLRHSVVKHLLNTAGINRFSDDHFDMVRAGIGLYGFDPSPDQQMPLTPAARFVSHISQISYIEPGESIGYNRAFKAKKRIKAGTLPIGYADGLRRSLGNGRYSLGWKRVRVPILGNICMDMCMIDLSNTEAKEGDEIEIFGRDLPISGMAETAETIVYEILTGISPRVKRIFYED